MLTRTSPKPPRSLWLLPRLLDPLLPRRVGFGVVSLELISWCLAERAPSVERSASRGGRGRGSVRGAARGRGRGAGRGGRGREFDRHSGSGLPDGPKRSGRGPRNWGSTDAEAEKPAEDETTEKKPEEVTETLAVQEVPVVEEAAEPEEVFVGLDDFEAQRQLVDEDEKITIREVDHTDSGLIDAKTYKSKTQLAETKEILSLQKEKKQKKKTKKIASKEIDTELASALFKSADSYRRERKPFGRDGASRKTKLDLADTSAFPALA